MKDFLHKVKNSIYNPVYYRELLAKPMGYSFRYFFMLIFLVTLFVTIFTSFFSVPTVKAVYDWALSQADQTYPAELEIKTNGGVVSTNVPEPYFIKVPDSEKVYINRDGRDFDNLLVIDTKNAFSIESFKNYKTVALLTRDSIVFQKDKNAITVQSLSTIPNLTINKSVVGDWLQKARKLGRILPALVVMGTFMGLFLLNLSNLLSLLLSSLFVWLLFWYWKFPGGYKKAYQIGLHAVTLPTLIYYLLFPIIHSFSFFELIFLVVVFVNLRPGADKSTNLDSATLAV